MSILDYIPSPAGGSITGHRTLDEKGFVNIATQSVWTAVFVFFILYQLFILWNPLVNSMLAERKPSLQVSGEGNQTESGEEINSKADEENSKEIYDAISGIGCSFRDGYLILLGTALIGMTGYGFYGPSLTLFWILFAILLIWSLTQLVSLTLLSGLVELSSMFVGMVLLIIIWGMAYYKPQIPGFA
jgi:hypothetical protein